MLYAGYASNVNDGTSLILSNTNSLSTQVSSPFKFLLVSIIDFQFYLFS